jgi:hypothetical protein
MPWLSHWLLGLDFIRARWRQAPPNTCKDVNGIDNFCSESVSIFKNMVCKFSKNWGFTITSQYLSYAFPRSWFDILVS